MKLRATMLLVLGLNAMPASAADLGASSETSISCLPEGAITSILPAMNYAEVKYLGRQNGATYFDARHDGHWYRVAVDSCNSEILNAQREAAPK